MPCRKGAAGEITDQSRLSQRVPQRHLGPRRRRDAPAHGTAGAARRRATLIGKTIDLKQAEAATFADTLDGLSAGLFLVDARGRIVHANMAARELLDAKTVLRSAQGQLMASDPQANQSLRAIFTFADGGDDALGIKGIDLPLPAQHGPPYVAHVHCR